MKVFIIGKETFDGLMKKRGITNDNVESQSKTFFISINDTRGTDEVPYFENKSNVKVIYFDDIDQDIDDPKWGLIKAFSIEQAKELVDFIDKQKDKESCIVHCAAGISRSGAVGTFVNDYFREDWEEFKRQNPYISPNGLVLSLLNRVVREKEDTNE